jgi:hypothetical protein
MSSEGIVTGREGETLKGVKSSRRIKFSISFGCDSEEETASFVGLQELRKLRYHRPQEL